MQGSYKTKKKELAVLLRIKENRKEILLFILGLIQGLAFAEVLDNSFSELKEMEFGIGVIVFSLHAILCFLIIIRLFETLLLGFLDYEDAVSTIYEVILVFVLGAFQYWLIDALPNFDPTRFYLRLMILALLSSLGYFVAIFKISDKKHRKKIFADRSSYVREIFLQAINLSTLGIIVAISILIINGHISEDRGVLFSAAGISIAVSINIVASWFFTMTSPKKVVEWDEAEKRFVVGYDELFAHDSVPAHFLREAEESDSQSIAALYIELFPYVFKELFNTREDKRIKLLSKVISWSKGSSNWGYANIALIQKRWETDCIGFIVFAASEKSGMIKTIRFSLYTVFQIIRYSGLKGLISFTSTALKNRKAVPEKVADGELYISYIGVLDKYRNKGYATDLLEYAVEKAKKEAYKTIGLDVRDDNTQAKNLFENLDFKFIKEINDHAFGKGSRLFYRRFLYK